jgi:hypothetical protein
VRHVEKMAEIRSAYRILIGKSDGKRPLGKKILRWNVEF